MVAHCTQVQELTAFQGTGYGDPFGFVLESAREGNRHSFAFIKLLKSLRAAQADVLQVLSPRDRIWGSKTSFYCCLKVIENETFHAGQLVEKGSRRNRVCPVLFAQFFLAFYDTLAFLLFLALFIFVHALPEYPGAMPFFPRTHHCGHMDAVSSFIGGVPAGAIEYRVLPAVFSAHRGARYFDKVMGAAASHPACAGIIVGTKVCDQTLVHLVAALRDCVVVEKHAPVLGLGDHVGRRLETGGAHFSAHVHSHIEQFAEVII